MASDKYSFKMRSTEDQETEGRLKKMVVGRMKKKMKKKRGRGGKRSRYSDLNDDSYYAD